MKTPRFFLIAAIALLWPLFSSAQAGIEKTVIASLGPGEIMASGENCFLLDKDPASVSFVTVTGSGSSKEYYCYGKDGHKTGPVKHPDESYWKECQDIDLDDCPADIGENMTNIQDYLDWTTGSIKFNGKSYGPFGQVILLNVAENKQHFFAVALTSEMKIFFVDDLNRKVELQGIPEKLIVSPDGSRAFAFLKGAINPFDAEAMEKMLANPEEMNNPKISLVGIDGTNVGPFTSDSFNDTWFTPGGKLAVYNNSEISLDGKMLFKTTNYVNKCDIWISNNGKDYAWADYDYIYFNDGTKFTSPLVIHQVIENGQTFLKWIALEKEKDLVLYRKSF